MSTEQISFKWVPVISEDRCTGCGLCVEACGPKCLAMVDGIAVLTLPDLCGSEEHCIGVCKDEAIKMSWVLMKGRKTVGRWRERCLFPVGGEGLPMESKRLRLWCKAIKGPIEVVIVQKSHAASVTGIPEGWDVESCLSKTENCFVGTNCPLAVEDGGEWPFEKIDERR